MVKIIGRQTSYGVAKETVRGTPEAAPTFWIPFSDLNFDEKQKRIDIDQAFGIVEDSLGQVKVSGWAEGSIKMPVYDKTIGLFLYALLGAVSSASHSGETLVKDHTFTVVQNLQHQALTFFIDDPAGADYKFSLGSIASLEFNYELNKFVEATATIKAKAGVVIPAGLTPVQSVENKFTSKHVVFKLAATAAGLTAASAMTIKKLNIKIDDGLEVDESLNSAEPTDFLSKQISIEGTVEAVYQNETDFKTVALGLTKKAMRIDLINNDVTIGSAANPEVRIDLNNVLFEPIATSRGLNGVVTQSVKFKAFYDVADAKMISALVTNLQASY
ncbi:MAG: phage tail tube protein [Candidatus Paceibacterota bacterium]